MRRGRVGILGAQQRASHRRLEHLSLHMVAMGLFISGGAANHTSYASRYVAALALAATPPYNLSSSPSHVSSLVLQELLLMALQFVTPCLGMMPVALLPKLLLLEKQL